MRKPICNLLTAICTIAATTVLTAKAVNAAGTQAHDRFRPVTFAELPGWSSDNHKAALETFLRSCKPILYGVRSGAMRTDRQSTPPGLLAACYEADRLRKKSVSKHTARKFFEDHFVPHELNVRRRPGLLTGYYEPTVKGSRKRTEQFQTPLYRDPGNTMPVPPTRSEIANGALDGKSLELLYVADPVVAYFMQIEGAGRVELPDGTFVRLAYAGSNGHASTSIARYLVEQKILPHHKVSRVELQDWLRSDPKRGARIMSLNKSFVFFREVKPKHDKGALGVMKIPLTPGRSLAVDSRFHPIGTPVFVDAPGLRHADKTSRRRFQRLLVAQDIGSAINGPERGDIFFGSGPDAGARAGTTRHHGRFFVLLPSPADKPHNVSGWEPVGLTRHARR